jgi:hypothetical protein
MFQKYVLFGLLVAVTSSIIGVTYAKVSYYLLFDFSKTIPLWKIVVSNIFLGLFFSGIYYVIQESFAKLILVLNMLVVLISFLSIALPIVVNIEEEFPEMFPSFAIPLHFLFPMLWLALFPYFYKKSHV